MDRVTRVNSSCHEEALEEALEEEVPEEEVPEEVFVGGIGTLARRQRFFVSG
jgi:hypothetical protein